MSLINRGKPRVMKEALTDVIFQNRDPHGPKAKSRLVRERLGCAALGRCSHFTNRETEAQR